MRTEVTFDWKEFSNQALEKLREALRPHGLYIYTNPKGRGSDEFMFFITDEKRYDSPGGSCQAARIKELK